MSFLKKISGLLRSGNNAEHIKYQRELETLTEDGRLHERFAVHGDGIAVLELENGIRGAIRDVSYGGMAVAFPPDVELPPQTPEPNQVKLLILDRVCVCRAVMVRLLPKAHGIYVGVSLRHDSADSLIFLRDLIEPLRCGKSLTLVPTALRQERYRSAEWHVARGDGPTDLLLKAPNKGSIEDALMTFRSGDTYQELSMRDGQIKTGKTISKSDSPQLLGSQMGSTSSIDRKVLHQALCILLGVAPNIRELTMPLLVKGIKELGLDPTALSQAS